MEPHAHLLKRALGGARWPGGLRGAFTIRQRSGSQACVVCRGAGVERCSVSERVARGGELQLGGSGKSEVGGGSGSFAQY